MTPTSDQSVDLNGMITGIRRWVETESPTNNQAAVNRMIDVVIDGERHPRAAWVYEAPRPAKAQIAGRFGFWQDVEVG